jgi:hypothetical protein
MPARIQLPMTAPTTSRISTAAIESEMPCTMPRSMSRHE